MTTGGFFNGKHWCNDCFVCSSCHGKLETAYTSREMPGKIFCKDCLSHRCSTCQKVIHGRSMNFEGQHHCLECFVCVRCGFGFPDGRVYKKDCGKVCSRCIHRPVDVAESLPPPAAESNTDTRRRLVVKAAKDSETVWQWQGGYLERGQHCGKPLFVRDAADGGVEYVIYYHSGFARWFLGKKVCTEQSVSFSCKSLDDASSPELCSWEQDNIQAIVEKTQMDAWDEEDKSLFYDKTFPHRQIPSIDGPGATATGLAQPMWVPARRLHRGQWRLFDGIDPLDLLQGKVGNCWLMAALAALAEYPKAVEKVFKVDGSQTDGRFVLQLFDYRCGQMVDIVVDEYIPCAHAHWWADEAEPYFSQPHGNEMWCLILEKALAKLFGSYAHLAEGQPSSCFRAVTGCTVQELWNYSGGVWLQSTMSPDHLNRFQYNSKHRTSVTPGDFWKQLCEHNLQAHLMSAIIDGTEQVRDDGLVEGHAYSLLFALEVPTLRGTMRMLMLRNPWGGDKEWKGRWSDNHPLWSQHQEVKSKLRPKFENDGVFWMQWEDFQSIFDSVHICQKSMLEGEALRRFRAGLQDFSHFDPARASRARGIAAKAKVIALAKMGLLRQRMAKEAGTPVEGTQSTGTQCFSFRAHDKVESKPAEGTEGTQSTGTQFFSFSAGDKAAAHPRERPGSKGEEGACGTSSTGTQVFSVAENDKAAHARERAAASVGDEGACGTSSTGTQFFSFAENEKAQIHARERAAAGKVDEGASGTASTGTQFFSFTEHDKELGRLTLLSQSAEGATAGKGNAEVSHASNGDSNGDAGTQSAGPQCFSFCEKDKAMWRNARLVHATSM